MLISIQYTSMVKMFRLIILWLTPLSFLVLIAACHNEKSNTEEVYIVSLETGAMSHAFNNMIKEFAEKTLELMGEQRRVNVNDSPCLECLNIFVLNTSNFEGVKDQFILGIPLDEFAEKLKGNALAIGSNMLLFDENLIAGVLFEARNYSLAALNIISDIKKIDVFNIDKVIYQGQYLSMGNTIGIQEEAPIIIEGSKKLAKSFYENFEVGEIERLKYIIKSGRIPRDSDDERLLWLLTMRGRIGGVILHNDSSKYVNPSKIVYGAFVMLLAHEISHLNRENSNHQDNSWNSMDDWIKHYENLKHRKEEDRADREAFKVFNSYLTKLMSSSDTENKFIQAYTALSFSNLMRNQVLTEELHYFRDIHIQDFLLKLEVNDCKDFQKKLPPWDFERITSLSKDNIPVLTKSEVKKIRDKFFNRKYTSTHSHYLDRSEEYNQQILNSISTNGSWIEEFYPFQNKILKLWTGSLDDISMMIDPNVYTSNFNKKNIDFNAFIKAFNIVEVFWEEGANCPTNSCWIGKFEEFNNTSLKGYFEIIANESKITNVKVVIIPQDQEGQAIRNQLARLLISNFEEMFGIEYFFLDKKPKYSDFLNLWNQCERASLESAFIDIRSVSSLGIAIEVGDTRAKNINRLVTEYGTKVDNVGMGDTLVYQAVKSGVTIQLETGMAGLEEEVKICYDNVSNINDVKICFIQHLLGFDLDKKFASSMEENFSQRFPTQEFFKSENVQAIVEIAFNELEIPINDAVFFLEDWKAKYLWYSTVVLSDVSQTELPQRLEDASLVFVNQIGMGDNSALEICLTAEKSEAVLEKHKVLLPNANSLTSQPYNAADNYYSLQYSCQGNFILYSSGVFASEYGDEMKNEKITKYDLYTKKSEVVFTFDEYLSRNWFYAENINSIVVFSIDKSKAKVQNLSTGNSTLIDIKIDFPVSMIGNFYYDGRVLISVGKVTGYPGRYILFLIDLVSGETGQLYYESPYYKKAKGIMPSRFEFNGKFFKEIVVDFNSEYNKVILERNSNIREVEVKSNNSNSRWLGEEKFYVFGEENITILDTNLIIRNQFIAKGPQVFESVGSNMLYTLKDKSNKRIFLINANTGLKSPVSSDIVTKDSSIVRVFSCN